MAPPVRDVRRFRRLAQEEEVEVPIHNEIGAAISTVIQRALLPGGGLDTRRSFSGFESQVEGARLPPIEINPSMANGVCPPGSHIAVDKCTGEIFCKKTRKRRKRLLTCSDKADIAFIIGQLGKGATSQSAISAMLARCA